MAKLTPVQVYTLLRQAGFGPAAAVTETAIAGAESGWDDRNLGDVSLENSTWGPSYGLFQIRTLKAETGKGTDRDISRLANDAAQAKAAYDISKGGTDFSAWTTYTRGTYQNFLAQATAAAGGQAAGVTSSPVGLPGVPDPSAIAGQVLTGARSIAVEIAFAVLGAGLVYVGLISLAKPGVDRKVNTVRGAVAKVI
jgi:hypothetical protein